MDGLKLSIKADLNFPDVSSRPHAATRQVLLPPSPHGCVMPRPLSQTLELTPAEPPRAALSCSCTLGGPQETHTNTTSPQELKQQESQQLHTHQALISASSPGAASGRSTFPTCVREGAVVCLYARVGVLSISLTLYFAACFAFI